MKINISNLSEGVHEYEFNESPSAIKLDERFSKPVYVQVELEKRRRQLFLTGHVRTSGSFPCDRCLDNFEQGLDFEYRMAYVYNEHDAGEVDKDEITVISTSTNEIDIDEDVRQYMLLAVPLKLLCKEDCAGLCGQCGANLNHGDCNCSKEKSGPDIFGREVKKIVNNK